MGSKEGQKGVLRWWANEERPMLKEIILGKKEGVKEIGFEK
jgi:hypothetical protein